MVFRFVTWIITVIIGVVRTLCEGAPGVDSGTRLDNMTWCRHHICVVISNDKEGLHWFVCAFNCRVRLELFTILVWEPLSSTHLIRPFLMAMRKFSLTTKHRALGFQTDGWSCGFQSLNIAKLVVEHQGTFSDVPLVPMGAGFVDHVLIIVKAHRAVRVVEAPGDDVEGVTELPGGPESPPSTQVEGAFLARRQCSGHPHPTRRQGGLRRAERGKPGGKAATFHGHKGGHPSQGPHPWRVAQGAGWLPSKCIWPAGA